MSSKVGEGRETTGMSQKKANEENNEICLSQPIVVQVDIMHKRCAAHVCRHHKIMQTEVSLHTKQPTGTATSNLPCHASCPCLSCHQNQNHAKWERFTPNPQIVGRKVRKKPFSFHMRHDEGERERREEMPGQRK